MWLWVLYDLESFSLAKSAIRYTKCAISCVQHFVGIEKMCLKMYKSLKKFFLLEVMFAFYNN